MHATATTSGLTAEKTTARVGQYMYAVIDCRAEQSLATVGIDGGTVRMINSGRLAAVVSEVPNRKIRPERRRLAAHHGVLEELRQQFTVLPIAFGVIADNPVAVREILVENREVFLEQIKRVAGNVEMGLRMSWDVPNIFDYFVETHDDLRTQRDQIFRDGRRPSQDELIDLGRSFDRLLNADRSKHVGAVSQFLGPCCCEIKENRLRSERDIMNLACLVPQADQKKFEDSVIEAARRFDNHYSFDVSGPWPVHNFVDISLDL